MQISDKMFGYVGKKQYLCTRNSEMMLKAMLKRYRRDE